MLLRYKNQGAPFLLFLSTGFNSTVREIYSERFFFHFTCSWKFAWTTFFEGDWKVICYVEFSNLVKKSHFTTYWYTLSGKLCHKFSHAKSCSSHLRKIIRPIRIAKDVIARVINMIRPIKSRRNSQGCVSFAPKFSHRPLFGSCLAEIQREEKWISSRKLEGKKFSISPSCKKEPANYSRRRRKLKLYVNL